jgi:hypothetical protein
VQEPARDEVVATGQAHAPCSSATEDGTPRSTADCATFDLTDAGRERMHAQTQHRASVISSLQRHAQPHTVNSGSAQASAHTAQPDASTQLSSSELHARARAAALAHSAARTHAHAQAGTTAEAAATEDLGALAQSVRLLQQQLQHVNSASQFQQLAARELSHVAAAAAVAAAQAVKKDSDSELSQVLKAVLLQQSSGAAGGPGLAGHVPGAWVMQQAQDSVHVQGQLLMPPAACSQFAGSATPLVRAPLG